MVTLIRLVAVVIGLDLDAGQHSARVRVVQLLDLGLDGLEGRQRVLALAQQDDALDLVVLVAPEQLAGAIGSPLNAGGVWPLGRLAQADPAQARLMTDHDAVHAERLARAKAGRPRRCRRS